MELNASWMRTLHYYINYSNMLQHEYSNFIMLTMYTYDKHQTLHGGSTYQLVLLRTHRYSW